MKSAMANKEEEKLSVIKMARAAIKNEEIEKRKDLEDSEVVEVLLREIKERYDAMEEYKKASEKDMVDKLSREIKILSAYLPEEFRD